jgi:hypothetical protein
MHACQSSPRLLSLFWPIPMLMAGASWNHFRARLFKDGSKPRDQSKYIRSPTIQSQVVKHNLGFEFYTELKS